MKKRQFCLDMAVHCLMPGSVLVDEWAFTRHGDFKWVVVELLELHTLEGKND